MLPIHAAFLKESFEHRGAISSRGQVPCFLLVDHPCHTAKIDLRPSLGCLSRGKLFSGETHVVKMRNRRLLEIVLGSGEHQTSDLVKQLAIPPPFVVSP